MIFVTVGSQLPFDRLIRAVDEWAQQCGRSDVFAQIGPGEYVPKQIAFERFIAPAEFQQRFEQARVVVGHAGMGTILTALELAKPLLVMPRSQALGEVRSDHQVATARRFCALGQVTVAFDEAELAARLDDLSVVRAGARISSTASPELLNALRTFICSGRRPSSPVTSGARGEAPSAANAATSGRSVIP